MVKGSEIAAQVESPLAMNSTLKDLEQTLPESF